MPILTFCKVRIRKKLNFLKFTFYRLILFKQSRIFATVDPKALAQKQAANIMKQMQGKSILSVGTVRNYEERLAIVAAYANSELRCSLRDLTVEQATTYLVDRATEVGQKTLDMERQAIQSMMQNVTGKLADLTEKLPVIHSDQQQILNCRSYTPEQVQMIASIQTEPNRLATELAYAAGLRAHELLTLRRIEEREPHPRPAREEKFTDREGERYTVDGKGRLIREVETIKMENKRLQKEVNQRKRRNAKSAYRRVKAKPMETKEESVF